MPLSLGAGESVIILERHERYETDPAAENAGSVLAEDAAAAFDRDVTFFQRAFTQNVAGSETTMVLFAASDTQYAGKGYRAMETTWIAQNAAIYALDASGLDPAKHIINFNSEFFTPKFRPSDKAGPIRIWPDANVREPQIFNTPAYISYLIGKYGSMDGNPNRLSPQAWTAHECDAEREVREALGAEGVYDVLARTKKSLSLMRAYATRFHMTHPNSRLIARVGTHYDTISPLVKDVAGIPFEKFVPVQNGGGVAIKLAAEQVPLLKVQGKELKLHLGGAVAKRTMSA